MDDKPVSEICIRPVTRYVVTQYTPGSGSRVINEYLNPKEANLAASAVAKALGLDLPTVRMREPIDLFEKADSQFFADHKPDEMLQAQITDIEQARASENTGPGSKFEIDSSKFEVKSGSDVFPAGGENVTLQDALPKS